MNGFLQYLVLGLGIGGIYALLALGIVVIYLGSGVLNLAQGAMAMLGAFSSGSFGSRRVGASYRRSPSPSARWRGRVSSTQKLVMRPLRRASTLARVVATLGLLFVLRASSSSSGDRAARSSCRTCRTTRIRSRRDDP